MGIIVRGSTRFTVSTQVNSKSADAITKAITDLLLPFKDSVLSVTADNGKEFSYYEKMTGKLDTQVYPKGTDLKIVTINGADPVI